MGQHLHIYASKTLTIYEVNKWGHARAYEYSEVPSAADQPTVNKVQKEMDQLRNTDDHFEHWSNWCGPMIWDFLVWDAHLCDTALIDRAITAASDAMRSHAGIQKQYPDRDFTVDEAMDFLRAHMGCVVWGDNDGI